MGFVLKLTFIHAYCETWILFYEFNTLLIRKSVSSFKFIQLTKI